VSNKYKNFRDIPVWTSAHELSLQIYEITKNFPKLEQYGITSQLQRAVTSINANLVEGFYRETTKELIRFLYQARGSAGEVVNFLILSGGLQYIEASVMEEKIKQAESIIRQLSGWIKSLKAKTQ